MKITRTTFDISVAKHGEEVTHEEIESIKSFIEDALGLDHELDTVEIIDLDDEYIEV